MAGSHDLPWQPSLFATEETVDIDRSFTSLRRIELDEGSWVDFAPEWVSGADRLFEDVLERRDWGQRTRYMYEHRVREPRLTSPWSERSGEALEPPVLEEARSVLSEHYGRRFDSVGFNLYRDGQDSVAWHADRIKEEIEDPIVALISLGAPRRFLLRPKGGGRSRVFMFRSGDLLVTGGRAQRDWEHSVPKVAQAGPRISLAYRHGMDESAYAGKRVESPE